MQTCTLIYKEAANHTDLLPPTTLRVCACTCRPETASYEAAGIIYYWVSLARVFPLSITQLENSIIAAYVYDNYCVVKQLKPSLSAIKNHVLLYWRISPSSPDGGGGA